MGRIVVVSNRVMELRKAAQAGGVAVAIADLLRERTGLWFGWNGKIINDGTLEEEAESKVVRVAGKSALATLPLTEDEHRDYYLGYSNSVLWPVFHNRLDLARFEAGYFAGYMGVNQRFARALKAQIRPDDTVWIHDYHLIPLGAELRRLGIKNPIGFYLHIPVPPSQTFLAIPEHYEIARALSAYDLIGLQSRNDVANLIQFFEDSASGRILQDGRIGVFDERVRIERFPVGIAPDDFAKSAEHTPLVQVANNGAQRIVGVDRLDYTKGLPHKFRAFGRFLEKYPQYRGNVVLSQIAPPTRESVEAYTDIRQTLEALSGKINGMFGELDWVPIHYIYRSTPRDKLRDIYRSSRIGFFTPLRDGMNLVAKEYVAAQDPADPGVPILSRFAGAAEQLVDALIVNPYNVEEMADAIRTALEMEKSERIQRYERLMDVIRSFDVGAWSRSFLARLEAAAEERFQGLSDIERMQSVSHSAPIRAAGRRAQPR